MFGWLIDFFESIGNLIVALITMIVDTITSLFQLITLIPEYITYIGNWFTTLPNFMFAFMILIPSILFIWMIRKAV